MGIRALEFYSGIGGLHRALELSEVDASVVRAFDWDQTASHVYQTNYSGDLVRKVDISTLTASDLVDLNAPLWLLSPSCQPYTVLNPAAKDIHDPRAQSFLHLVQQVIPDLARNALNPKWILVENVAGFEASTTRKILLKSLEECNYATVELLLTPLQFGIPNSRLRYYLLAKQLPLKFTNITYKDAPDLIWRHIPGDGEPWEDQREGCDAAQLSLYLDPEHCVVAEDHLAKIPARVLLKWGRLFDIVLPSSRRSCCFTRGYTRLVERSGSILQTNEELDTTRTFDTFLAMQKQAASSTTSCGRLHAEKILLDILEPLRLRYFTPSEMLRLFQFEPLAVLEGKTKGFIWPADVSSKSKYRLLGNSVNVEVVRRLLNYLFDGDDVVV